MVHEFQSGGPITATDYNEMVTDLNAVYGLGTGNIGYGGKSQNVVSTAVNLPLLAQGDIVENERWIDLRNAMNDAALHQDTVLPNPVPLLTNLEDGDEIGFGPNAAPLFASLNGTPPNNVTVLTANRLNSDILNFETNTKLSSVRITPWGSGNVGEPSSITHEFTVAFSNSDHARHFFNTGGEIRLSASRAGGSVTPQNISWTNLVSGVSPFVFGGIDYFNLTSGFVVFLTTVASTLTTYGNPALPDPERNSWVISARRDDAAGANGGNGSVIRFRSQFNDGFLGPSTSALGAYGTPVGGPPDLVDGVFTSVISQKRSSVFFNIPTPTYTNITQINI